MEEETCDFCSLPLSQFADFQHWHMWTVNVVHAATRRARNDVGVWNCGSLGIFTARATVLPSAVQRCASSTAAGGGSAAAPCHAFSGVPLPGHLHELLRQHAQKNGFVGPFWISGGQLKRRNIPLKQNQVPIQVNLDPSGDRPPFRVINFAELVEEEVSLFLQDVKIPPDAQPGGIVATNAYRSLLLQDGKFKSISETEVLKALAALRIAKRYPIGLWIAVDEAKSWSFKLPAEAELQKVTVQISDGCVSALYHVQQTSWPLHRFDLPDTDVKGSRPKGGIVLEDSDC